jgi:hypothetical protein
MVIPTVPQLHASLLGPHISSTDIDRGSFNANLVCGPHETPGTLAGTHPSIKFDQPIQDLRVIAKSVKSGRVMWDASYVLGGSKELLSSAQAAGGAKPVWTKVCTEPGNVENYKIDIVANGQKGQFNSSVSFTSNNAHVVQLSDFLFPQKPDLPKLPADPPTIKIDPHDFLPYKYM